MVQLLMALCPKWGLQAIAAAAICVSITCYFPSKPPSPNSPSSDTDAVEKTGIMVGFF